MATLTPEEERARREAALLKMEKDVKIIHDFVHSPKGTVIQTESGPLDCLATVVSRINEFETTHDAFIDELAAEMEKLPIVTPVPAPTVEVKGVTDERTK